MRVNAAPILSVRRKLIGLSALAALLVMPGAATAAVTIVQQAPEQAVVQAVRPAVVSVSPLSKASIPASVPADLLGGTSDFARAAPANTPFHHMTRTPIFGGLSVVEIALVGGLLIAMAVFVRRRHRRLVGWGFMPERSQRRSPPAG